MKRLKFVAIFLLASSLIYAENASSAEQTLAQSCPQDRLVEVVPILDCDSCDVTPCFPNVYEKYGLTRQNPWVEKCTAWLGNISPVHLEGDTNTFIEFLYWNPQEEGLDYASNNLFVLIQPPQAPSIATYSVDSHTYRPGFRVGLDFTPCCSQIDFGTQWTWFYSSISATAPTPTASEVQVPLLLSADGSPTAAASHANWALRFNTIDAEVGYTICPECFQSFLLRPKCGLRGALIHQGLTTQYTNVTLNSVTTGTYNISTHNKNNFWGVGLHAGADLGWNFCQGWTLFCNGGGSLLSGQFNVSQTSVVESFTTTVFPPNSLRNKDTTTHRNIVSGIDIAAGVSWATQCFCPIELSLGWEFQLWFSQNQLHTVVDPATGTRFATFRGNLSLQGVVARAMVTF